MTKQELENRKIELETELNKIRKELSEYDANQKKKEYGDKYSCEFCKFNAVSGFSSDGWHNTCGKGECTCCHDACDFYEPDNEITLFIKKNVRNSRLFRSKNTNTNGHGYLTEDEYSGLKELVGDIFYHEQLTEKFKKVLTACFDTEKKQIEGEWVFDDYDESGVTYRCSCCKTLILIPGKTYPKPEKCPSCGAKMKNGVTLADQLIGKGGEE